MIALALYIAMMHHASTESLYFPGYQNLPNTPEVTEIVPLPGTYARIDPEPIKTT